MSYQKKLIPVIIIALAFLCSSCATIIYGTRQKVEIFSIPDSCTVYLNGENTNKTTPAKLRVKRRVKPTFFNEKNQQSYILKKEGYYDFEIKDKAKFSPLIFGNILLVGAAFGGNAILPSPDGYSDDERLQIMATCFPVAGLAIDAASGSYNKYQSRVFGKLQPKPEVNKQPENIQPSNITSSGVGLALCIGNGNYPGASLPNAANDGIDIASALKMLGYDVMQYTDLDHSAMLKAVDEFGKKLEDYKVGLFFYAGHGIQAKGINYLIPVDAVIRSENDVEYTCVNAGRILSKMEDAGSKTNIVILDACRNNPFERSWTRSGQSKGLAVMDAPVGSVIGFATSPGSTASDGAGRNGEYTAAILKNINEPGINILELFQKVRKTVRENTAGRQVPWESTSLEGNYYFKK
jgi:hypothetical protein